MPRHGTNGIKTKMWTIDKHRYLELQHKCLQYPMWKEALEAYRDTARAITYSDMPKQTFNNSDSTADAAIKCKELSDNIDIVEKAIRIATDSMPGCYVYLLKNITEGATIQTLEYYLGTMQVSRNTFYKMRRQCFWILDQNFN